MTAFGLAARWAYLVSGLALVGTFSATLLAGPSDRPTALTWAARILSLTRWLGGAVLLSGLLMLAHQTAVVAGRTGAILEPSVWLRLLTESQFGTVWLVRHGLLVLLAALSLLREREDSSADFITWRLEGWGLGAVAVAAAAWAGHAAAVEPLGLVAALADALHLVAAGTWLGALFPLSLLLRAASKEQGADARPYAVLAVRRFSAVALIAMLLVVATGLWNTWVEVGSVPALLGTRYGRLLLVKVALLVPILALAVVNRRRLLPALSGDGATVGRPAMTRLSRFIRWELALALLILGVTGALSLTAPARHESPWWPFSYRLSYDSAAWVPGAATRVFIGGQIAFLGLLAAMMGWLMRGARGRLIAAGLLALGAGLWIALPPLAMDAYPTTYRRPPVPYQAASVARGLALYATHCAACHGPLGKGDGPGGTALPKPPADLTAPHAGQHTAGDLFWWITYGFRASGMPPFAGTLPEEDRWDLINYLRALSAGEGARALTARVEPNRPGPAAPDFTYAVGPTPARTLREFRGRRAVVLVLFSLPGSRPRLGRLAESYAAIQTLGGEVLAVPLGSAGQIITRLGADPPILFPVVTDGVSDIVQSYGLFARAARPRTPPSHVEFLVDRQGFLRARWIPAEPGAGWSDPGSLETEIEIVNQEAPTGPPPDEHVH